MVGMYLDDVAVGQAAVAGAMEQQLVVHREVEHRVVELILEAGDPDVEGRRPRSATVASAPVNVIVVRSVLPGALLEVEL
jgi:hypothetical protein